MNCGDNAACVSFIWIILINQILTDRRLSHHVKRKMIAVVWNTPCNLKCFTNFKILFLLFYFIFESLCIFNILCVINFTEVSNYERKICQNSHTYIIII